MKFHIFPENFDLYFHERRHASLPTLQWIKTLHNEVYLIITTIIKVGISF